MGQGDKGVCDATSVIGPEMGESYKHMKSDELQLLSNFSSVSFNYTDFRNLKNQGKKYDLSKI